MEIDRSYYHGLKLWQCRFGLFAAYARAFFKQIGQGTYSTVFRARDLETGKIVALKKVRFDNFEPESVRFMAREIMILRRLDHPNVIKLEGLITSRSSCNIYLVFEYMEHDISGLLASTEITFTEAQVSIILSSMILQLYDHVLCSSSGLFLRSNAM